MNQLKIAGLLIESAPTRHQMEALLLNLGFHPVHLTQSALERVHISAFSLIVVEQSQADSLQTNVIQHLICDPLDLPPIVVLRDIVLRDAASTDDHAVDIDFDGVLQLPLTAELSTTLGAILHAHQALKNRFKPLLEELKMSRRVMQSVTNGITIADATLPDLPLIYVNPAFERMTGYTLDEVRGRNCRFLQDEDTQQIGLLSVRNAIREHRDTLTVLKNYRKDGTPFWNELYLSPLWNDDGKLTHFVGIQSDVTRRIEDERNLKFLAHHDSLTGLANRELLFDRFNQAILRAGRNGAHVALLFFDLNNFKNVNDLFGHDAGDKLLRIVSERLKAGLREVDTVARLGGDEFVILIPDLDDEKKIPAIVRRTVKQICQPVVIFEQSFEPSISIGWSVYPRDGSDPEQLLKAADFAMYADKHSRRLAELEGELPPIPPLQHRQEK